MKVFETEQIVRATEAIDSFTKNIAYYWHEMSKKQIQNEFVSVFFESKPEKIKHLIDRWYSMNRDIAGFYLGIDEAVIRQMFNYYLIELEPDKYDDSLALRMALMKGASRWDVFPFESHTIRQFYLMANNNSLELLFDIIPNAKELLETAKIDLFGNGRNWSSAWLLLNDEQKLMLSAFVLTHKF
ncbi:hypothetical protein M2451_003873 [Dysgonomonas sp. PFB1-18]|uniref:hypothetical protein n=1 Tax=unclassified Dysgonomonas TaxID=2630389 RepID=UPI00247614C2|nr:MULTISPECIES: hypothetical protein [unclassified Dysgonomonas]MDH6311212.1 hypothetical protein [Dysgonomonas sp. PF1-14]MDH6341096.1 hypothetical protein [Dysgonomonas sp. PF1-16]MDH6382532.1 hypothetical protein [Dysgonomonas sp. PFB1-18]MDH6399934.1 hypothetical protein [Dysgonomonas sp. PF1-23]